MSYALLFCAVLMSGLMFIRLQNLDYKVLRYNDYLLKFHKSYSAEEYQTRLQHFEASLKEIERLNSAEHGTGATHGLTKFSDWSKEEQRVRLMGFRDYPDDCKNVIDDNIVPPLRRQQDRVTYPSDRFDWRESGIIGPVQNQKLCNGCWAFGIVGVMEAMAAKLFGDHAQLSVQEMIDCTIKNRTGCSGGNLREALGFMFSAKFNLTTEDNYPLILVNEKCMGHPTTGRGVSHYAIRCAVTDEYIIERLLEGPVVAVINPETLSSYLDGIIQQHCGPIPIISQIYHVVIIVGYDKTGDTEFYTIQNSWGEDWGEKGFFRVAMGDKNVCGVRNQIANLTVYK